MDRNRQKGRHTGETKSLGIVAYSSTDSKRLKQFLNSWKWFWTVKTELKTIPRKPVRPKNTFGKKTDIQWHRQHMTHRHCDFGDWIDWINENIMCHMSCGMCQLSGVSCQVSGVRCQVSGVACHLSSVTKANSHSHRPSPCQLYHYAQ